MPHPCYSLAQNACNPEGIVQTSPGLRMGGGALPWVTSPKNPLPFLTVSLCAQP